MLNTLVSTPRLPLVRHAQIANGQRQGPERENRLPARESRPELAERAWIQDNVSQKCGLAPENSHHMNTEQQPDVSVVARHSQRYELLRNGTNS